uniref:DUF7869 domain-containing protein n=1 Tax=Chromera velia CCMP2878 TaxID=1169474 RepID=A0A0G4HJC8_9ALVE|eukprot:Cvel_28095.t1-p1 / transcript=Cvel_28095.t1 / gene=Cvel_28095 / organism=Chromera_velia_CCMP2878 / gene_product=hypothetical protein / transcript_product=hypothetical protein / location=Cvel_scaffold3616:12599-15017(+) / protein_length=500 / sequence_SO=supercontig / SO=protein_coding / is_pseudo=false
MGVREVQTAHRVDASSIRSSLAQPCCTSECCREFAFTEVRQWRVQYEAISHQDQNQWLLDVVNRNSCGKWVAWKFLGRPVCSRAFRLLTGIGMASIVDKIRRHREGHCRYVRFFQRPQLVLNSYRAWLREMIRVSSCKMPDRDGKVQFPFATRKQLFQLLVAEHAVVPIIPGKPALSTFYQVLREFRGQIVWAKQKRFSKCDRCAYLSYCIAHEPLPGEQRKLEHAQIVHVVDTIRQRLVYYDERRLSQVDPHNHITIIMDGMDQNFSTIPHCEFNHRLKSAEPLGARIKLIGVMAHGRGKLVFAVPPEEAHGSNMTVTVLNFALTEIQRHWPDFEPRTFHLQMDNTSSENKNMTVLAYLNVLVHRFTFEQIVNGFLPVGHTHEDIDAFFGVLSKALKASDFFTVDELFEIIRKALEDSQEPIYFYKLYSQFDWKTYLLPHVSRKFDIALQPVHAFRIRKNPEGKIVTDYKKKLTSSWTAENCKCQDFPLCSTQLANHFQ